MSSAECAAELAACCAHDKNTINRTTLAAEIAASMVRTLIGDLALFRHQTVRESLWQTTASKRDSKF
jgi:hypothetical protein